MLPCAGFAAGIVAARYARFDPWELGAAFALLTLIAVIAHLRTPRVIWLPWLGCMAVAGAWVAEFRRPLPPPLLDAEAGETLLISGCVVEPLSMQGDRARFTIEIEPDARLAVSMRLNPKDVRPPVRYGSIVEFTARVRAPRNYGNPGAFDYVNYLARRRVFWLANVQSNTEIHLLPGRCGSRLEAALTGWRQDALARLQALLGDSPEAGFLRALLLGDDDGLNPVISDEFRRTGTYHAIVISGLHVSLVAGSLLWLLRRLFAPGWLRLPIAFLAAWAYTLIAGSEAPVLRAALGFTLGLIATASYRRLRVLNILAAVALAFLIVDPQQLFEPSFQLSFAAVAAIGGLAKPLYDRTSAILREAARDLDYARPSPSIAPAVWSLRVELRLLAHTVTALSRIPHRYSKILVENASRALGVLFEMVMLSVLVQFSLVVPSIVYFHRVPLTSVLANLFAVPLLNGAVAAGLGGLIAGSPALSSFAAALVRVAESITGAFARIEPDWRHPTPSLWLRIAFVVGLCVFAWSLRRRRSLVLLSLLLTCALGAGMFVYEERATPAGFLELSVIDVGQGDSLFLALPDGRRMLIDGGGFPVFKGGSASRMDIGEQVVSPYLWERGIRRIDIVAMTHAHDDHAQGLSAILRNFRPAEFWTGATPGASAASLLTQARASGIRVWQPRSGELRQFGSATVRVLAPRSDYTPAGAAKNNDSLVLEICYGQRRFLLTGDAERAVEASLVSENAIGHVDVLKVGHHGSKTSTTPDFLGILRPTFGVVSVGEANLYGHPHPDVVGRMREEHVQVLRTDRAGLTQFRTDGRRLSVESYSLNWRP